MQKAGGYEYSPEELKFSQEMQKSLGGVGKRLGPEKMLVDKSERFTSASTNVGDVSWVVPTAQFTAATFVPGVAAHTWQAARHSFEKRRAGRTWTTRIAPDAKPPLNYAVR